MHTDTHRHTHTRTHTRTHTHTHTLRGRYYLKGVPAAGSLRGIKLSDGAEVRVRVRVRVRACVRVRVCAFARSVEGVPPYFTPCLARSFPAPDFPVAACECVLRARARACECCVFACVRVCAAGGRRRRQDPGAQLGRSLRPGSPLPALLYFCQYIYIYIYIYIYNVCIVYLSCSKQLM